MPWRGREICALPGALLVCGEKLRGTVYSVEQRYYMKDRTFRWWSTPTLDDNILDVEVSKTVAATPSTVKCVVGNILTAGINGSTAVDKTSANKPHDPRATWSVTYTSISRAEAWVRFLL